jgi:hypothetical protein
MLFTPEPLGDSLLTANANGLSNLDPVGLLVGIALFLVGIPLAYLIGRRNRQVPDLRRAVGFDRFVSLRRLFGPGVNFSFEGREIPTLSRSYLAIWNHRGDHVDGDTILATDPLRIVVDEDDEILQVRLVSRSKVQNGLGVAPDGTSRAVSFVYLEAGDGGIFEVLHTGSAPARIEGTIPGARLKAPVVAALTPGSRAAVRASRVRRFGLMNRAARYRTLFWLTAVAASLGIVIGATTALVRYLRSPELVPTELYDLRTISGQLEFASQVSEAGAIEWPRLAATAVVLAFGLAVLLMYLRRIYRVSTAIVPRSIVEDDLDPHLPPNTSPEKEQERRNDTQAASGAE